MDHESLTSESPEVLIFGCLEFSTTPFASVVWGGHLQLCKVPAAPPLNFEKHHVVHIYIYMNVWYNNLIYKENIKSMTLKKSMTQLFNPFRSISHLDKT